jgi:hypothetical protein
MNAMDACMVSFRRVLRTYGESGKKNEVTVTDQIQVRGVTRSLRLDLAAS